MNSVNTSPNPDLLLSLLTGMVGNTSAVSGVDGQLFGFAQFLDSDALETSALTGKQLGGEFPDQDGDSKLFGSDSGGELNALIAATMGGLQSPFGAAPSGVQTAGLEPQSTSLPKGGVMGQSKLSESGGAPGHSLKQVSAASGQTVAVGSSRGERSPLSEVSTGGVAGGVVASIADTQGGPIGSPGVGKQGGGKNSGLADEGAHVASDRSLSGLPESLAEQPSKETGISTLRSKNSLERLTDARLEQPELHSDLSATAADPNSAQQWSSGVTPEHSANPSSQRGWNQRSSRSSESRTELAGQGMEITGAGFHERSAAEFVTSVASGGRLHQDSKSTQSTGEIALPESPITRKSEPAGMASNPASVWESNTELTVEEARFEQALEQAAETFPLESVAQQIATSAEPDAGWISVEIQPPELGKLEIMVSKQGDDYLARIVAHEASTGEALNLQQTELIEALSQHGLELKEVQITTDGNSGSNWNPDGSGQEQARQERQQMQDYRDSRAEQSQRGQAGPATSGGLTNRVTGNAQVNILV